MIVKTKKGYTVKSHTTGRSFGTYKTKKAAHKRLRQMKGHGSKKRKR
jgi:hypothetical protein